MTTEPELPKLRRSIFIAIGAAVLVVIVDSIGQVYIGGLVEGLASASPEPHLVTALEFLNRALRASAFFLCMSAVLLILSLIYLRRVFPNP